VTSISVSISIPALSIVYPITLPTRPNRATNLIVATLYIPFSVFNAAWKT